jgi:hypothetical protein
MMAKSACLPLGNAAGFGFDFFFFFSGGMGLEAYKTHFCALGKFPESNGSQKGIHKVSRAET